MIKDEELKMEEEYLSLVNDEISKEISSLGSELISDEEKSQDFKKFIWDNKAHLDPQELKSLIIESDLQVYLMTQKGKYFQKLYTIQNSPYFGSIIFNEKDKDETIYIGITHLTKNDDYLIHDWRAPICSLFYDYEVGPCMYKAPKGEIKGILKRKRQYKIENKKLLHVFDNNINIEDDLLQEVLANESNEKMKNIVNTIAKEQNEIIRNIVDKHLIVQGIAGSGKTSVALHRVAFLLYRIENLTANNVLIISPNNIFSEYISNVLPELGEDNALNKSFQDFFKDQITEYKNIETFAHFISRYYKYEEKNKELVKYKQSDEIIKDIESYADYLLNKATFTKKITDDLLYDIDIDELNDLLKGRYNKFPLFERIEIMANKFSEKYYNGKKSHVSSFRKKLLDSINISKDYMKLYKDFYLSEYSKIKITEKEEKEILNKNYLKFEDASIFLYLKGLLAGFPFNPDIKQVVIDEAQDYSKLEYIILSKIFKKSNFTILGDINQTINPYYKYETLESLKEIFPSSNYYELNKTYRSTKEIIDFTNKILGLNHVSAIRRDKVKEVLFRKEANLKEQLEKDLEYLSRYKSIAIITKDDQEAKEIHELLKNKDISLVEDSTKIFKRDLIIIPAYIAKGLEFDAVIVYNKKDNIYKDNEKYLYYVACTRAQHELIIYNYKD